MDTSAGVRGLEERRGATMDGGGNACANFQPLSTYRKRERERRRLFLFACSSFNRKRKPARSALLACPTACFSLLAYPRPTSLTLLVSREIYRNTSPSVPLFSLGPVPTARARSMRRLTSWSWLSIGIRLRHRPRTLFPHVVCSGCLFLSTKLCRVFKVARQLSLPRCL